LFATFVFTHIVQTNLKYMLILMKSNDIHPGLFGALSRRG
jgi:hypothetical protein